MRVQTSVREQVTILTPAGDLNADTVARFTEAVEKAMAGGARDFIADLSGLTGIDSAGLEAFTALLRRSEETLGIVAFCGAGETIRKILEMTRLDRQLTLCRDVEEAMDAVGQAVGSAR